MADAKASGTRPSSTAVYSIPGSVSNPSAHGTP